MTHKFATACFAIAAALGPIAAHAADSGMDREHPTAFVRDSVITTKIKAKMAAQHLDSLKNIRVDTDANAVVSLSGTVNSRDEANKAVTIARNTEGVKSVSNELRVEKDR